MSTTDKNEIFKVNIEILKKRGFISGAPRIKHDRKPYISLTPTGEKTIEVSGKFLHSKYNPLKEAERLIEASNIKQDEDVLIIGFAMGYHVKRVLQIVKDRKIIVFEGNNDVFYKAIENIDFTEIFRDPRFELVLCQDSRVFSSKLVKYLSIIPNLLIHRPSMEILPTEYHEIKDLLKKFLMKKGSIDRFLPLMYDNFEKVMMHYQDFEKIEDYFGKYRNVPIILVGAGPSLDEDIQYLKKASNYAIIFSVGTAVKPLVKSGVIPHMIIITDPQPIVFEQIRTENLESPLIFLPTTYWKVIEYRGPKILALQEGFKESEYMAAKLGRNLIETGGSVITTALDIAIKMGCNPIIFTGVDLGFFNSKTHAKDTVHGNKKVDSFKYFVKSNEGNIIPTFLNLKIYHEWIQKRIEKEKRITFINTARNGAYIKGARYLPFSDLLHILQNFYKKEGKEIGCKSLRNKPHR